ncbi:hypothetical protein AC1031_005146 [Aphanomyces cochlioides]|nr:hypothetical protein AC1031_005146 [Aphanomyces cochlioides]
MGNHLVLTRQNDLFWTAAVLSLIGLLDTSHVLAADFSWRHFGHWFVFGLVFFLAGFCFLASIHLLCYEPFQPWIHFLLRWPLWLAARAIFIRTCLEYAQSLCCCFPSLCPHDTAKSKLILLDQCGDACLAFSDGFREIVAFSCSILASEVILYAYTTHAKWRVGHFKLIFQE